MQAASNNSIFHFREADPALLILDAFLDFVNNILKILLVETEIFSDLLCDLVALIIDPDFIEGIVVIFRKTGSLISFLHEFS